MLVAVIVGLFGNIFAGYLTPVLSPFFAVVGLLVASLIFIVLKLDLHKKGGVNIRKYTALIILVPLALIAALFGASVLYYLQTSGTIVTAPPNLTVSPSSIDWGSVTIGANVTRTVNITNTGGASEVLTMTVANSTLTNYTLSWDLVDWYLMPNESVLANFTLAVHNASLGDFSLWINIGEKP